METATMVSTARCADALRKDALWLSQPVSSKTAGFQSLRYRLDMSVLDVNLWGFLNNRVYPNCSKHVYIFQTPSLGNLKHLH